MKKAVLLCVCLTASVLLASEEISIKEYKSGFLLKGEDIVGIHLLREKHFELWLFEPNRDRFFLVEANNQDPCYGMISSSRQGLSHFFRASHQAIRVINQQGSKLLEYLEFFKWNVRHRTEAE